MLHSQTVFAVADRPEKFILTTRMKLLCALKLTAGDRHLIRIRRMRRITSLIKVDCM
jgi:hypothetical protein